MAIPNELSAAIDDAVAADARDLIALAANLHANPELRFEEVKAAAWISELVGSRNIAVENGLGGMPTALRARAGTAGGPRVAILAEYDALPRSGTRAGTT
jgi:metal-dependent amidase/aminoacylase/carboxypeptidase family protein